MDLRSFIGSLEQSGQLNRITQPIHWKHDLGAYCRVRHEPLLFENIRDYPGFTLFANGLSNRAQIARALSLSPTISRKSLIDCLESRLRKPQPPVMVKQSPVTENAMDDLFSLPVPWWHPADGGRYLGTWHVNITRDPTTGINNCGIYRMQLLGSRSSTLSVSPRSHLALHLAKAEKAGRPLEMAVCIGVSETLMMAAAAAFPAGACEYDYAGGLEENPLELIPCRTIDLNVPANSEIVIEGVVEPGVRVTDGPFFDYAGVPNVNPKALRFNVSAIMHRTRPIFRGCAVGVAGAEDHQLFAVLALLGLVDFHGSPFRQTVQNFFFRHNLFRTLQRFTKAGQRFHRVSSARSASPERSGVR